MKMMKIFGLITLGILLWFHYAETVFERLMIAFMFICLVGIPLIHWIPTWFSQVISSTINKNQVKDDKSNEKVVNYSKNNYNFKQNHNNSNQKSNKQPKNPSKYYPELQQLLSNYSKTRQLTREMILTFITEIDYRLKTHKFVYDSFKFENDMHQIYVKIQSKQFEDQDYVYLINVLNELVEANTTENNPSYTDNEPLDFDMDNVPW